MKKFDFKDITIVPEVVTTVESRNIINLYNEDGYLPLMVSPMDTVIDEDNYMSFLNLDYEVCIPRGSYVNSNVFISISLDEFETLLSYEDIFNENEPPQKILVDIANGHMTKLHSLCEKFVSLNQNGKHKLMVGNIANPKTYKALAKIGVDYVRVGIGGGSGCLTSANLGVHYPMGSLIQECYKIKSLHEYETRIVADGGFKNYDDIIKALALGADYVMLGGILNKTLESCSQTKLFKYIPISKENSAYIWKYLPFLRKYITKNFRGMSTKEVQKKWGKTHLRTSEGITKTNPVEYTLEGWTKNFKDYLASAMSYTNSKNLKEFKESEIIFITPNALNRFSK